MHRERFEGARPGGGGGAGGGGGGGGDVLGDHGLRRVLDHAARAAARWREQRLAALVGREAKPAPPRGLGFGRIVALEIEVTNMLAISV